MSLHRKSILVTQRLTSVYQLVIRLKRLLLIYSSVNDNWTRVALMHSIARDLYASTANTDFRDRITGNGDAFPFDANAYTTIENESTIVGMVMAWSVVTLEALVNHQLAEQLGNMVLATMAIEYPAQVTDKLKISRTARSELAKKLIVLSGELQAAGPDLTAAIALADALADKRNMIIHDKPFRYTDRGDGHIVIDYFRSRGDSKLANLRFVDLTKFYANCDSVKRYVSKVSSEPIDCDVEFSSLLGG